MVLKFLTLNVYHGFLIDKVVSFLKKEAPDIVHLQEVYDGKNKNLSANFRTLTILKKELNYPYFSFYPLFAVREKKSIVPQGNLTLSKFPIIGSKTTFFNGGYQVFDFEGWLDKKDYRFVPKGILETSIKIKNSVISTLNIHGLWGFDGKDNPQRFKVLKLVQVMVKNKTRVILAGDFNLSPNTKFVKTLEQNLTNVFQDKLKTTFNVKRKQMPGNWANSVVDMIFVTNNIKVVDKRQPDIDVSDHLPLVATLTLKE